VKEEAGGAPTSGPTWRLQGGRGQDARGALHRRNRRLCERRSRRPVPQQRVRLDQAVGPAAVLCHA